MTYFPRLSLSLLIAGWTTSLATHICEAAEPSPQKFEGIIDQINPKSFVKLKNNALVEVLQIPPAPIDLAKGINAGDSVEGTYKQENVNQAKFVETIRLKHTALSPQLALGRMALGILIFLVIAMVLLKSGHFKIRKLVIGADRRTSNSKTQAAIWFGIVIASYVSTLPARIIDGGWSYVGGIDIPQNLLILSGISAGTFAGAKLVTANRVASGVPKPEANAASVTNLFSNDKGQFDLGDFQMFAWALLAAGIYLLQMIAFLQTIPLSASVSLPDVDTTLLSFFGIGQGAYLTKKTLGEVQPQIASVTPPQAAPGSVVTIAGSGFGEKTGYVRFGTAMAQVISWLNVNISVEVPQGLLPGQLPLQVSLTADPSPTETTVHECPLASVSFTVLRPPVEAN